MLGACSLFSLSLSLSLHLLECVCRVALWRILFSAAALLYMMMLLMLVALGFCCYLSAYLSVNPFVLSITNERILSSVFGSPDDTRFIYWLHIYLSICSLSLSLSVPIIELRGLWEVDALLRLPVGLVGLATLAQHLVLASNRALELDTMRREPRLERRVQCVSLSLSFVVVVVRGVPW